MSSIFFIPSNAFCIKTAGMFRHSHWYRGKLPCFATLAVIVESCHVSPFSLLSQKVAMFRHSHYYRKRLPCFVTLTIIAESCWTVIGLCGWGSSQILILTYPQKKKSPKLLSLVILEAILRVSPSNFLWPCTINFTRPLLRYSHKCYKFLFNQSSFNSNWKSHAKVLCTFTLNNLRHDSEINFVWPYEIPGWQCAFKHPDDLLAYCTLSNKLVDHSTLIFTKSSTGVQWRF